MAQYIPDITERFPEGYGGIDMTPTFFGGMVERSNAYQKNHEEAESCTQEKAEPKCFKVGQTYRIDCFDGGITYYTVLEIDREKGKLLLLDQWEHVDGHGTRGKEWHSFEAQEDGTERCLDYCSETFGEIWFYAY